MIKNVPKPRTIQKSLFEAKANPPKGNFVSIYRVSLVKDASISFGGEKLQNAEQAQSILRKLLETRGQSDREMFAVILLNARNEIIGLNIVSIGGLSSASVVPREVYKPAIIANAAAMILCHNHPSNNLEPSREDLELTRRIIQAAKVIGIQVHEHLIISMESDQFYSFADHRGYCMSIQCFLRLLSNMDGHIPKLSS